MMKKRGLLHILIFLIIVSTVSAADHYVSPSGSASWPSCTNINIPCSLSTANSNAQAGDTVYMREGTYNTAIAPVRSGTSHTNRITYRNLNDDKVIISGVSYPLTLNGRSWITITGTPNQNIIISNSPQITDEMKDSSYNIFAYITAGPQSYYGRWSTFHISQGSHHNWVHHCTFHDFGSQDDTASGDLGDMVTIGWSAWEDSRYGSNVIEDNIFYHGGHNVVVIQSAYNVFRNNRLRSDAWFTYNGVTYGSRTMAVSDRSNGWDGWNLIEGNKFTHTDPPIDTDHAQHIQSYASNSIYRRNTFHSAKGQGIIFYTSTKGFCTPPDCGTKNNYVYHNTFFRTGLGGDSVYSTRKRALMLANWGWSDGYLLDGTVIKNNVYEDCVYSDFHTEPAEHVTNTVREGEFGSDDGDPMFADETIPQDRNDYSKPDFAPRPGSPLIDKAVPLTYTASSGSGTTLKVDDAHYFYPGDGAPWNIPSYITDPHGDYLFVDGWSSPAEIDSINYDTNTITLVSSRSWSDNAKVYLAVSPTVGYYGNGPDIGAIEYSSGETSCIEDWQCTQWSGWSACAGNEQTRTRACNDINSCGTTIDKPSETETQYCSTANGTYYETRNSEDTLISTAQPEANYGALDTFYIGSRQESVRDRVLLKFPGLISADSVPENSKITSATLVLTATGTQQIASQIDLKVMQVLEPWTEGASSQGAVSQGETTWDYRSYNTARWQSDSGGDGGTDAGCSSPGSSTTTGEASAVFSSNPADGQESSFDVTSIVQEWTDKGESSNHGFLLIAPAQEGSTKQFVRFASSENSNTDFRPILVVDYSIKKCGDADLLGDGVVDITDLINYINRWKSGEVSISEIMSAIGEWKYGC